MPDERDDLVRRIAIHGQEPGVFQPLEGQIPLRLAAADDFDID